VKNSKLAAGAEVEVKAGSLYQKAEYAGIPLVFGLGSHDTVETIRITWPNGLIQNELKGIAGRSNAFAESQRLSGSCPTIFAWDGIAFEFISDVLGVAPLGASAGDGRYFPVDHDEYVQISVRALGLQRSKYQIRLTEELHEVSYIDQVQLVAVDHPADVEIFTNEKFKAPPFPEFRLYGASEKVHPVLAHDQHGCDVLDRLLREDRRYPDDFARDSAGVAEMHVLDLDFGRQAAPDNHAALVLRGWVDWADGSTFVRAAQSNRSGLVFPYLQVKDRSGRWQTIVEDMGVPAGKPKAIVVDLGGAFLSPSREVRIVTNVCVYWDEIFLIERNTAPAVTRTPMSATAAKLQFRGFSRATIDPRRRQPEIFEYADARTESMWNPTPGMYTRYGDVTPLLSVADDRFVIMGSGDELALEFSASGLPDLPAGWTRDFLFLVDGWAKDADANTAYSQSVKPLPFHAMSSYPYLATEHFPADDAHRQYEREFNTRPALRLLRPLADASRVPHDR